MATRSGSRSQPTTSRRNAELDEQAAAAAAADPPVEPPVVNLPPVSGLHGKLALVLGEMERVAKTGWNDAQKYRFATIGDIADMIRASLASHGVNFHATIAEPPQHVEIRSRNGTVGDRCTVHMQFTLIDGDNPDDRERSDWWAHGDDYQDKSVGKAVTACTKSYLVNRFLVSTGEPEPDSGGEQRAALPAAAEPVTDRPATENEKRRMFAIGREHGVDPQFVRLTARLLTRTHDQPHGVSLSDYTLNQIAALEVALRNWESRPGGHDEKMGRLAAALEEQAAKTAASASETASAVASQDAAENPDAPPPADAEPGDDPTEPEQHDLTCTCGAGPEAPGEEHDPSCPLSIPF